MVIEAGHTCTYLHESLTSSGASGAPAPLQSNDGAHPVCSPQQASADICSSQPVLKSPFQGTAWHQAHGSLHIKAAMKPREMDELGSLSKSQHLMQRDRQSNIHRQMHCPEKVRNPLANDCMLWPRLRTCRSGSVAALISCSLARKRGPWSPSLLCCPVVKTYA